MAALDLLHVRERDADHRALDLADGMMRCTDVRTVTIATHAAAVGTLRHVALTIGADGCSSAELRSALTSLVPADLMMGLLVGDRFDGQPELHAVLDAVRDEHVQRSAGRVVVFPGADTLVGTVTVAHVLDRTAVDEVRVLAGDVADRDAELFTRDFVRPRWRAGRLVLDTQPARGGVLVPFETPDPTPCCADHA